MSNVHAMHVPIEELFKHLDEEHELDFAAYPSLPTETQAREAHATAHREDRVARGGVLSGCQYHPDRWRECHYCEMVSALPEVPTVADWQRIKLEEAMERRLDQ